jgi:hypothetical protein
MAKEASFVPNRLRIAAAIAASPSVSAGFALGAADCGNEVLEVGEEQPNIQIIRKTVVGTSQRIISPIVYLARLETLVHHRLSGSLS